MGIFDFLRKSTPPPARGGSSFDKRVAGPAKVVADKRAQTYDRLVAIQALAEMQSRDAAAALLRRFTFSIDPSITDQEEKELAFQGIIAAGKDAVLPVREFCLKADVLTWPIKVLREILKDDEYEAELLKLLERFDIEYARNVEPKIQVLNALEESVSEDVRVAVERFLEDVNETVRFCAVQTTFNQDNEASIPALVKLLEAEESVRVKNKVAEGFLQHGWVLTDEVREATSRALRESGGYFVGKTGKVEKR